MKSSIKFMISFLMISLVISVILVSYSINFTEKFLKNDIENKLQSVLSEKIQQVEIFLSEQEEIFYETFNEELFASLLELSSDDEKYNETLQLVINKLNLSRAVSAGITDSLGVVVASRSPNMIGVDISASPGIPEMLSFGGKEEIDWVIIPGPSSSLILALGRTVYNSDKEIVGATGTRVSLNELKKIVGPLNELGETADTYLINKDSLLLTPSRFLRGENKGVLVQIVDTESSRNCRSMKEEGAHKDHDPINFFLDYRGEEVIGTHDHILEPNWCLLVEVDKEEVIDVLLKEPIKKNVFFSLIGIFVSSLIGFFIGNYFDKKNKRRKIKKYPCGRVGKFKFWYCRLYGAKCHTYPNGRCGIIIKRRNFFINLKLRYYFLFALIFSIGYFVLITSLSNISEKFYNSFIHIGGIVAPIILLVLFLKSRNIKAKNLGILGSILLIFHELTDVFFDLNLNLVDTVYFLLPTFFNIFGFIIIFFAFIELNFKGNKR